MDDMSYGGRRTELDGVRGIAILLVLVGHANYRLAPLAAAGVGLFFTLSGYLITCLLLDERRRVGRVDLSRFYARRLTRLAPPLFVMLGVIGVIHRSGWEILAPAAWVANYAKIANVYIVPFDHTWSLAVEEQFYLVWPLALMMLMRLRRPSVVLRVVMATQAVWWLLLVATGHLNYAYEALETAGIPILGGCLVALHRERARYSSTICVVALAAVVTGLSALNGEVWWIVTPVLVAPLTMAIVAGAEGTRWLGWRPLGFLGLASYSLYLWHQPVGWLVGGQQVTAFGVFAGAATGLIAYLVIERPLMAWREQRHAHVPSVAETPQLNLR